jgi:cyclopropane-fatty-acyl-phospholipid synthase
VGHPDLCETRAKDPCTGTGWGALSILIAKTVDCTIDTVTLSGEQRDLATARIAQAGLSDRIRVHYMDFRESRKQPGWAGAFDRFVSVEMIENVGREFIEDFWAVADWALKPRAAIGVVQVITMPEASACRLYSARNRT